MGCDAGVCEREQAMAITCEAIWRESSNYIDGTLSPDLQQAIDEHIETCQACASVLAAMNSMFFKPEVIIRFTAFAPPPPTPITLITAW